MDRRLKGSLAALATKKKLRVAGLMSGTSADGVDVAIVDLYGRKTDLLAFATFPYPAAVRRKLFELFEVRAAGLAELGRLNVVVGELFASALIRLADEAGPGN